MVMFTDANDTDTFVTPQQIVNFWFEELAPQQWWKKDPDLDGAIAERFGEVHAAAVRGELAPWRETAEGRLAEILILDQFSRNIFRGTPKAFAQDELALARANEAIAAGHDVVLPPDWRVFLYMPFMHSESVAAHKRAIELFDQPGLEQNLKFEHAHHSIVSQFGRYPHRNEVLGRVSTPEEIEFLKQPGSSF